MEILSDQSSFSREMREEEGEMGDANNLFLWSIVIVVLLGLNAFSWIFCMYVFGNPEVPFNYRLLVKLDKLDPIEGFKDVTAPRGNFFNIKQLYGDVYEYGEEDLNVYNNILKRLYLYNYDERNDVTFISGDFQVVSVRHLESGDVFPRGLAIRARAIDFPAGYVDLILPSDTPPALHYKPGDHINLEESASCFAVLHVQWLDDEMVCFTAVPLVMRNFETPAGTTVGVRPPERLNLDSGRWPMSEEGSLPENQLGDPQEEAADDPEKEVAKGEPDDSNEAGKTSG